MENVERSLFQITLVIPHPGTQNRAQQANCFELWKHLLYLYDLSLSSHCHVRWCPIGEHMFGGSVYIECVRYFHFMIAPPTPSVSSNSTFNFATVKMLAILALQPLHVCTRSIRRSKPFISGLFASFAKQNNEIIRDHDFSIH